MEPDIYTKFYSFCIHYLLFKGILEAMWGPRKKIAVHEVTVKLFF